MTYARYRRVVTRLKHVKTVKRMILVRGTVDRSLVSANRFLRQMMSGISCASRRGS